jgi:hypothetical protein
VDECTSGPGDPFFGGYYRDPQPATVVAAFHGWCKTPGPNPEGCVVGIVQFGEGRPIETILGSRPNARDCSRRVPRGT